MVLLNKRPLFADSTDSWKSAVTSQSMILQLQIELERGSFLRDAKWWICVADASAPLLFDTVECSSSRGRWKTVPPSRPFLDRHLDIQHTGYRSDPKFMLVVQNLVRFRAESRLGQADAFPLEITT